jgi:putative DNA methylase
MNLTGWKTRGYLPHRDEARLIQHVVFGLQGAFPNPPPANLTDPTKRAIWADRQFDRGYGRRLLSKPANAQAVEDCLLHGHGERYALAAWCVMPTHDVVVDQFVEHPLSGFVQKWKSISAHAINKREGRKGVLWQREYFDRFMRSERQLEWTVAYVENNPVAARLVEQPYEWRFSSAWWRRNDAGEDAGAP